MPQVTFEQAIEMALGHHQAGRLREAEAIYRQVLAARPDHVDALHLLGAAVSQQGNMEEGVQLIKQALALAPSNAVFHSNLGKILADQGKMEEAVACYRRAIALNPDYPEAHGNLGIALVQLKRAEEAVGAAARAVELRPGDAQTHFNLGTALQALGRWEEAIAANRRAIQLMPGYADAHNNLAVSLKTLGRLEEALAAARRAVELGPKDVKMRLNLAEVLFQAHRLQEALPVYQQAIQLDPKNAEAHCGLANVFKEGGRPDEALPLYRRAIELKPEYAVACANLGAALRDRGEVEEALAALRRAAEIDPDSAAIRSSLILTLYLNPATDRGTIAKEKREWDVRHVRPLAGSIVPHGNERSPERRLRIGYVSPDLREHPVGRFMLPLLANHDHRGFEIFCYSGALAPDAITRRAQTLADVWREIPGMEDAALAELIRRDGIDILVDLAMHTVNNHLPTFARKPAPVQVTYLACCDGAGLSTMDYRLTDPYLDPAGGELDEAYERPVRLPESYWCYAPGIETPAVGALPAVRAGRVTFGSLNDFCKITTAALLVWCGILREVPTARLLLFAPAGSAQERVRRIVQGAGISGDRLELVTRVPVEKYFARYGDIDIALDPFPYCGGTTTCDALWMGVPVVSLAGTIPTARGGVSILSNMGLPELIARTEADYVRMAAALAGDVGRLAGLRATLRERMEKSPLTDAPRFARNVEGAYREMWRAWCAQRGLGAATEPRWHEAHEAPPPKTTKI